MCICTIASLSICLDNFLQGKCFCNQQEAENAFQEFIESQSTDFYAKKINLFLTGRNVLIIMVPILINKDVFEPSYNDLRFTVRNCNYFFTNLIYPPIKAFTLLYLFASSEGKLSF